MITLGLRKNRQYITLNDIVRVYSGGEKYKSTDGDILSFTGNNIETGKRLIRDFNLKQGIGPNEYLMSEESITIVLDKHESDDDIQQMFELSDEDVKEMFKEIDEITGKGILEYFKYLRQNDRNGEHYWFAGYRLAQITFNSFLNNMSRLKIAVNKEMDLKARMHEELMEKFRDTKTTLVIFKIISAVLTIITIYLLTK